MKENEYQSRLAEQALDVPRGTFKPYDGTIELSLKWIETEPDGGKCYCCKDVIYLKAIEPIITAGGKTCGKFSDTALRFCQSCATAIGLTTKD